MIKYITAAEAEQMRREARAYWGSKDLGSVDHLRSPDVIGVVTTDYYIVPDDDPRLTNEQRRQVLARRLPAPDPLADA